MTSPFLASGLVKSASCALDGTSGAFCQLKCFSTVQLPPALPSLGSCAPTPVRRSMAAGSLRSRVRALLQPLTNAQHTRVRRLRTL